jgi:prolyl-tRNA editing enzyme YbaK/EbsC (Cys-tRNA(Pro) deacylase)
MAARDPAEVKVLAQLDALGVDYEVLACDPDFADTAAFCARYGIPPQRSANAILVEGKRGPERACVCLVAADARLDVNHAVRPLLGVKKASFASPSRTVELTGMQIGGVSIFGLPDELPKFIDSRLLALPWAVVGGGSRSMKIRVAPEASSLVPSASVIEGLALPIA